MLFIKKNLKIIKIENPNKKLTTPYGSRPTSDSICHPSIPPPQSILRISSNDLIAGKISPLD
jgi:hypothetical protein